MMKYPDYEERNRDRPVRLERTEGTIIIEGKAYPAREVVEALAQSGYSEIRSTGDSLILGRRKIAPIYKSRQERAMAALCHDSLSYCCPLSKRCAERDRALEILGLTNADYEHLKGTSHHKFLDASKGTSSSAYDWGQVPPSRAANQPASDRGFGTDDYRRDFDALDRALDSRSQPPSRDERAPAWGSSPSPQRDLRESSYGSSGPSPFTDVSRESSLMDEMQLAARSLESSSTCRINTDPSLEGIGSLFAQGELSPFSDDAKPETGRLSFCFSCGRTFEPNTKVCPYCGAPQ
ncbi:MAG: hypothetical protein ACW98Y_18745 [Candidatus Thorarchaeota archaeon]|jgi:hypothetical protein